MKNSRFAPAATIWASPPPVVELPDEEVHVWRAGLDVPPEALAQFHQLLSPDEQEKAARFHFEKDRRHYTAARGLLRTLLGQYLGTDPKQLHFVYNAFGKPALASASSPVPLQFNVAHSHGLALFAFNRGRQIGVDLELVRPDVATQEIAGRFFAPAEVAALNSLPEEVRTKAFFNCWTRKEAFIKARGLGLSLPLKHFAVSLAPGENPALLSAKDDPDAPKRWILRSLDVADSHTAALAVEGREWELRCWYWA